MKIVEIIIKLEDSKQTLYGDEADTWFKAMVDSMRIFPVKVVTANWKRRKLKKKVQKQENNLI